MLNSSKRRRPDRTRRDQRAEGPREPCQRSIQHRTKTRHGRARSATNSLRHGLNLPIQLNSILYEEARALAIRIAGPNASAHRHTLALRIAEAEIDLRRVRVARQRLLSERLNDPDYRPPEKVRIRVVKSRRVVVERIFSAATALDGPDKLAAIMSEIGDRMLLMDRYERRARSRRKFAVRVFDAARSLEGELAKRSQK